MLQRSKVQPNNLRFGKSVLRVAWRFPSLFEAITTGPRFSPLFERTTLVRCPLLERQPIRRTYLGVRVRERRLQTGAGSTVG